MKCLLSIPAFQFPPTLFKFRPSYLCPGLLNWVPPYFLAFFLFLFPVQLMYCCQIIFLNYSSDHANSLLQKVNNFPLPSKSFNGVFKVIQRYVLRFPPQPYFSAHLACTAYSIKSDYAFLLGQEHSFSACLPLLTQSLYLGYPPH